MLIDRRSMHSVYLKVFPVQCFLQRSRSLELELITGSIPCALQTAEEIPRFREAGCCVSLLAGSPHARSNQFVTVTYIAFERTSPVLDALYVKKPAFEG